MSISIQKILSILSIIILLNGCKKEEEDTTLGDPDLATPVLKSIYICGYEINENGKNVAKYWKDDVEFILSGGGTDAIANAIWVEGSDVYVAGSRKTSSSGSMSLPVYWKNSNEIPLSSNPAPFSAATDIFIDGNDVYVVGYERNDDGVEVAKMWLNGEPTDLSNGTIEAKAFAVFVENGDVHVVGTQNASEFNNTGIAMHWINGIPNELTDGETEAAAFDIDISNGNVYICGVAYYEDADNNEFANKMVWLNDVPQNSPNMSISTSANGICVDGSDVYLAGYNEGSGVLSGYWKNGGFISLDPGTAYMPGGERAWKIAVDNNDVYVVGSYSIPDGSSVRGVYWKNGEAFSLGSTPYQEGLYDIFIK
jgi:hypothetical protein